MVHLGSNSGQYSQLTGAVAIGQNAGQGNQSTNATAVGQSAGQTGQSQYAVALGAFSGAYNQQSNAIAIGQSAGQTNQQANAIAIGQNAGQGLQSSNAIAIGQSAGQTGQNANAIAIGQNAGQLNQGTYSIALGYNATITGAYNIFLNASGTIGASNGLTGAFFVNPIRGTTGTTGPAVVNNTLNMLMYNTATNEIQRNTMMTVDGYNAVSLVGKMSATTFQVSSDYRIKENVVPLPSQFNVDQLNPVYYQNTVLNNSEMGFLAHDVQREYPFLVSGEKDGASMQSLNYTGLIPVLVKEIKEMKDIIKRQDAEIRTLRIQMDYMLDR
jgi:hypothetical protein